VAKSLANTWKYRVYNSILTLLGAGISAVFDSSLLRILEKYFLVA